jgi:maltose/moltooligosaccharide transporter
MHNQPYKSTNQIISLCIGFLGIQIGFALQAGNVTRILQNFGADLSQVSFFWLIAPLSGAIVQPLIGYFSDKNIYEGTTRVPYLLFGGIICAIALYALPNAGSIINMTSPLLIGGLLIILIDLSFNISMHPLRATITDYIPSTQQPKGFAIQTVLISIGAILGSALPYILHDYFALKSIAIDNDIPQNVKWSFYLGSAVLLICIFITAKAIITHKTNRIEITPPNKLKSIRIPNKMWQLGLIQFFSWAGFFLIWIFMTPAIAQHIYNEFDYSAASQRYAEAANYTGVLFSLYHLSAGIFALCLPFFYDRLNIIMTHFITLLIGGIGLIMMYYCTEIKDLIVPMIFIGIAWASILASPFALLSRIIAKQNIGLYLGIFNLFITVPQIIIGLVGGLVLESHFDGKAIYAVLGAGCLLLISSMLSLIFRNSLNLR